MAIKVKTAERLLKFNHNAAKHHNTMQSKQVFEH